MMQPVAIAEHRPFEGAECLIPMPGAFAASPDGLTAWAAHAGEGRMCVFARVALLPHGIGARSRQLRDQGLVTLQRTRHKPGSTLFDFAARRTSVTVAEAKPLPANVNLPPDARQLLDVLANVADLGDACPNNAELAALIGVRNERSASHYLHRLVQAGMVRVTVLDPMLGTRQVTIVETGAQTRAVS